MTLSENYSLLDTDNLELQKEVFPGSSMTVVGEVKKGLWLLYGPPKVGKSAFCTRFVCDRISEERSCVYVLTNTSPQELRAEIVNTEPELEDKLDDHLTIIDCYSWRFGNSKGDYTLSNVSDLSQLSILIRNAIKSLKATEKGFGVVFDKMTTIALEAGPAATINFYQSLVARLNEMNCFGVFTLDEGVHPEPFANTIKVIFHGVFEMRHIEKDNKLTRAFRIFYLPRVEYSTEWVNYKITPRGIEFPNSDFL